MVLALSGPFAKLDPPYPSAESFAKDEKRQ
jgi:hypothetical protein